MDRQSMYAQMAERLEKIMTPPSMVGKGTIMENTKQYVCTHVTVAQLSNVH